MAIRVQVQAFDPGAEVNAMHAANVGVGAVVSFVGYVRDFHARFGLNVRWTLPDGRIADPRARTAERAHALDRVRAHALEEAVRWGEPYSFFLAPGLMAWMVPVTLSAS